jgi:mono/diheme cytochrome c family protein
MNRLLKGLGIVVLALAVLAIIAISLTIGWRPFIGPKTRPVTATKYESTPERLKRGEYVAVHVAGCTDCHTPFVVGPNGPENTPDNIGAGQIFPMEGLPGPVSASNITPDPETGIGNWSDDEIGRAIREGVDRNGRTLFPLMPYTRFRNMSDEDLASVVVYLRSLKAVHNPLPPTAIISPVKYLIQGVPQPITVPVQADLSTHLSRGKYLAGIASCEECHTVNQRGQPLKGMFLAGGAVFKGSWGTLASANITPDPSTGIGNYTEASFVKTMHTGYVGTRQLNTLMPWQKYAGMTDEDLKAIYAYLKTAPAVVHHVDNSKTPTPCKKCGASHGAGDAN